MKYNNELLSSLQEAVCRDLPSIQEKFEAYQNAHFIPRTPEFFALELSGETGELANLIKKQWRQFPIEDRTDVPVKHSKERADHIAEEAADVFISLVNFANAQGIDLGRAVERKLGSIKPSKK